ncbi:hypothetical protein MSAN_01652600 [Mycena sanguinolenta]|uniref:Uncharacterized protein n=1 Tax=Mycena sanguinolenta TaxID=230812 RepID=A0A8H7CUM4_9AGAR|nr:hypothetical protein MSAN_01652600 [Mycena sanguinolenta]
MFGLLAFCLLTSASAIWLPGSRDTDMPCHKHPVIESRAATTTMTNGSTILYGTVGNMIWDASGVLAKGCNTSTISNCYNMYLTSNASAMLDTAHLDSPRQRNEWHFPTVSSGKPFSYSWKQYLDLSTGSSIHFFHLMQVFGIPENGPIVALDALSGSLKIVDSTNTSCGSLLCPSTPLSNYLGVYTTHLISGTFGPSGSLSYTVTGPSGKILSYSRKGGLGAGAGYIKFGTYRLTFTPNMTVVNTMVGDWQTYL